MTVGETWMDGGAADAVWGRARELDVVCGLGQAPGGALIVGEPGIGKSVLWARGVAAVRASGVRVLVSTCVEAESGMPYAGLEDLLGGLDDAYGAELPGPQRGALDAAFLRADADPCDDAAASPRTVAAGALTLLRRVLDEGPVLLAVDDLQWLDEESRTCLAYAVRRLDGHPLLRLFATRDPSPLWSPATPPADDAPLVDGLPVLRLEPLSGEDIRGLLNERLGLALAPEDGRRIARDTGGNPFWALEFGRDWRGAIDGARPPSLGALVADRIARLDPAVVDAASLVAALGRPRSASILRALAGADEHSSGGDVRVASEVVDGAVAAGLVTVVGDRLTSTHPLLGSALEAALLPFRRRRLHRLAAAFAESAEARALHLVRATAGHDPDGQHNTAADDADDPGAHARRAELVDALDDACRAARRRGAASTAVRFAARALAAVEATATAPAADRMVTTAELHYQAGEKDAALSMLERLDLTVLDADLLERAAPLLAQTVNERRGGPAARAVADTVDAVARTGLPPESLRRREALVATLRADLQCGATGDRLGFARCAVEYAEASATGRPLRRRALGALAHALFDAGEPVDGVLDRRDALGVPDPAAEPGGGIDIEVIRGLSRWLRLDVAGARAVFAASFERQLVAGDTSAIVWSGALLAYTDLLSQSAEAAEKAVARIEDQVDRAVVERMSVVNIHGMLHLVRGEYDALDALLDRQADAGNQFAFSALFAARLRGTAALHRGDPARAVALLDQHADIAERQGFSGYYRGIDPEAVVDLAEALIATGDYPRAARIADDLGEFVRATGHAVVRGQRLRILARLAAHRDDDLDNALALAREAADLHGQAPIPPEHARSLATLADLFDLRGDPEAAAGHRGDAHAIYVRLGYRAQAARTAPRPLERWALSPSERAVAALVAGGATNREAAAALSLSVRTIENHLHHVYRKLAVHSRTDLTGHPALAARP